MRGRKRDSGVGFNLWNVQGAWFWSLVYPDTHSGAIGAATSEAEAVGEARAAIERLPLQRHDSTANDTEKSRSVRRLETIENSQFGIYCKVNGAGGDFPRLDITTTEGSPQPTMSGYTKVWQLTLQRYAARVALA
jgi:hypothetical protein